MSAFRARAFDPVAGAHVDLPLPIRQQGERCRVSLAPVHGASSLQLLITNGQLGARVEAHVSLDYSASIPFDVTWLTSGKLSVTTDSGRELLFLPPDARYEPALPVRGRLPGSPLDLLFLIDATCQMVQPGGLGLIRRLSDPDAGGLWTSLATIARGLAGEYPDFRCGFLAYGDQNLPGRAAAEDLLCNDLYQPAYSNGLMPYSDAASLELNLRTLRPTSGGDWVDGMADAMARISTPSRWRPSARKLLVVVGDSPGHSILNPAPPGCDAHARTASCEEECDRLHRTGVEIAVVYLPASDDPSLYGLRSAAAILAHAREQYRSLASLSSWYWDHHGFESQALAALATPPAWIARGSAYGSDPVIAAVAP